MFILRAVFVISVAFVWCISSNGQSHANRILSGTVLTQQFELVPNVTIEVQAGQDKFTTISDAEGNFSLAVPAESLTVKFSGKNINPVTRTFSASDTVTDLQVKISYIIAPFNESVTIRADPLTPEIEQWNDEAFSKNKNFVARDDQIIQSLNAGISAGQHEGGGKSIEIRRFGFNLDHGALTAVLRFWLIIFSKIK